MRRCAYLMSLLVAAMLMAACERTAAPAGGASGSPEAAKPVALHVMTFNIEWGGKHVSFDNVVTAIRLSGADVVGIQEAEGNLEELAGRLGWNFDERNYVISRFPLIDPPGANGKYVLVELRPNEVVAVSNLHLPSDPYGPDLVRDGASLAGVLANERKVRMPMLRSYLEALAQPLAEGMPLFLTGDFNSPAHTDWTASAVGSRPYLDFAVEWPVTVSLEKAGLRDSWRTVYPDVARDPGLTWWAGRPPLPAYAPGPGDAQDRIDMVWFAGPVVARSAKLAGEVGRADVDVAVDPWPSDHRGVIVSFDVEPRSLPDVLTSDRWVYREGDAVTLRYRFASEDAGHITLTEPGSGRVTATYTAEGDEGTVTITSLAAGRYFATARTARAEHVREFWVLPVGAVPAIGVAKPVFAAQEPVLIQWSNAPGFRNDYIAVYAADAADDNEAMLSYAYIDALPAGELDLRTAVALNGGTLPPGRYVTKLLKDDGYEALAETGPFQVE